MDGRGGKFEGETENGEAGEGLGVIMIQLYIDIILVYTWNPNAPVLIGVWAFFWGVADSKIEVFRVLGAYIHIYQVRTCTHQLFTSWLMFMLFGLNMPLVLVQDVVSSFQGTDVFQTRPKTPNPKFLAIHLGMDKNEGYPPKG